MWALIMTAQATEANIFWSCLDPALQSSISNPAESRFKPPGYATFLLLQLLPPTLQLFLSSVSSVQLSSRTGPLSATSNTTVKRKPAPVVPGPRRSHRLTHLFRFSHTKSWHRASSTFEYRWPSKAWLHSSLRLQPNKPQLLFFRSKRTSATSLLPLI
jgi:hypothetical protein